MARREVLNNPVRLGERAPDILICAAARPPKLARAAAPNGGSCSQSRSRSVTAPGYLFSWLPGPRLAAAVRLGGVCFLGVKSLPAAPAR